MHHRPDRQTAEDVDHQDEDARGGVAAYELAGAVHRTVEIRFRADLRAARPRLFLVDQAGVQIRVDRHLLARHGIKGEARTDLGDASGALGDDHEVDDGEDDEDHDTDGIITADDERSERLDDVTGRCRAVVPVHQHHACGGDIQRQPKQRCDQQHSRENREVERLADREHRDHDHHRQGDVEGEQQIECDRRQWQDHHREQRQYADRDADAAQHQLPKWKDRRG